MKRTFDAKVWKSGNSHVVTIPCATVKRLEIEDGNLVEMTIKR